MALRSTYYVATFQQSCVTLRQLLTRVHSTLSHTGTECYCVCVFCFLFEMCHFARQIFVANISL